MKVLPYIVLLVAMDLAVTADPRMPQFRTLFNFDFTDGSGPSAVVIGHNGVLYGTASYGGTSQMGTVFSLTPPSSAGGKWTETVLHNFTGVNDGAVPGTLLLGTGGVLYGLTSAGGVLTGSCAAVLGCGTIFSLTPAASGSWTEAVLYQFTGGADGSFPVGLALGPRGVLYGMTNNLPTTGVGTVFSLTPPASPLQSWKETVLYTFSGTDGGAPEGGVTPTPDGTLYGTTSGGGTVGLGVIFKLTPPASAGGVWTETVLYNFAPGLGGANPVGNLIVGKGGVLYGVTSGGALGNGGVFSLTPPSSPGGAWTEVGLHAFTGSDGALPQAGVVIGPGGILYGTTDVGGTTNNGVVFALLPPSSPGGAWTERVLHNFAGPPGDGARPGAPVTLGKNGWVYGTTTTGGLPGNWGTVFALPSL